MLSLGIVGLPNAGKSSLFNALTAAKAEAANYPFCTVDPNVGMVEVPDLRLVKLAEIVKPERTVPAVVQFVDIAGLVMGAVDPVRDREVIEFELALALATLQLLTRKRVNVPISPPTNARSSSPRSALSRPASTA